MNANAIIKNEWDKILGGAPASLRESIYRSLTSNVDQLRERYWQYLESDEEINSLIPDDQRKAEFAKGFFDWVFNLFDPQNKDVEMLVVRQAAVGAMMARIGYPPHAVSRSVRKLKIWFIDHIQEEAQDIDDVLEKTKYLIGMIDISLDFREMAYQQGLASLHRSNEAYRIYGLGQNLAMERERQRALLMEWSHALLAAFNQDRSAGLPQLAKSEFGQWLQHKAVAIFNDAQEIASVIESVRRIDTGIVPELIAVGYENRADISKLTKEIERELSAIKFNLTSLFDLHLEIENGRDPLTHLLNRRFLPSILKREISLSTQRPDCGFCVIIADIDHFKAINDTYGHDAGDSAIQQVAATISNSVRASDFVFRYGGEEILIAAVECDLDMGTRIAENIRRTVEDTWITLSKDMRIKITVSIGISGYANEIDYESIVSKADRALYEAKNSGRNIIKVAA